MKIFKQGAELKLTRKDIKTLLTQALSDELFKYGLGYRVTRMTLHPKDKYAVRLTIKQ